MCFHNFYISWRGGYLELLLTKTQSGFSGWLLVDYSGICVVGYYSYKNYPTLIIFPCVLPTKSTNSNESTLLERNVGEFPPGDAMT
jgi:hypothetical protein